MRDRVVAQDGDPPVASRAVGIVLCAGASARTGSPKALARRDGRTFLAWSIVELLEGGCERVGVVVAPPHELSIRCALELELPAPMAGRVDWVRNPDPARGMWSSLQVGLASVQGVGASAVVVALVDHPRVRATTVRTLLQAHAAAAWGVSRFVPVWQTRRGHPYVLSTSAIPRLMSESAEAVTSAVLSRLVVADVEVDDPGVVDDLDTPEAIRDVGGQLPKRE